MIKLGNVSKRLSMRPYIGMGFDSTFDTDRDVVQTIVEYHVNPNEQTAQSLLKYYREKLEEYIRIYLKTRQKRQILEFTLAVEYDEIMEPDWEMNIKTIRDVFYVILKLNSEIDYNLHDTVRGRHIPHIYPLVSSNGYHYYNSYLYALVNGVHLEGVPHTQQGDWADPPYYFHDHDMVHILNIEKAGIMDKDNLRDVDKIRTIILESEFIPMMKELLIFTLWVICHECCWSIKRFLDKKINHYQRTVLSVLRNSDVDDNWRNYGKILYNKDKKPEQQIYYDAFRENIFEGGKHTYDEIMDKFVSNYVYSLDILAYIACME